MTIVHKGFEIDVTERCGACPLRSMVLFADLQQEDLDLIHKPITAISVDAGEQLYAINQSGTHVYTIREGLVKLVQYLPNGDQRIVRMLKQGDLAGIEVTTGSDYQHDAIVLSPVEACKIPVEVVHNLSTGTPRLHKQLMNKWQDALSSADAWLTELSTGAAKYRVYRLLLWIAQHAERDVFYMPSREDIGAMLGLTTETVSRIIATLRREKVIEQIGTHDARADIERLQELVDEEP